MGRKSRIKKNNRQGILKEAMAHPLKGEIRTFLDRRGLATDKDSGLLYSVSMMVNFLIYGSIKERLQLPVIRPEEEEADKNRRERLGIVLGYECRQIGVDFQEVLDELVYPMAGNKVFIEPIFDEVYGMLASLVSSNNFRQTTEGQIESQEFWGDSLTHYADRKEDYFRVVKELFTLVLAVTRSGTGVELEGVSREEKMEEIQKTYRVDPDDFLKLRRRASEFFRIAFATYLNMQFQPVREDIDKRFNEPGSDVR